MSVRRSNAFGSTITTQIRASRRLCRRSFRSSKRRVRRRRLSQRRPSRSGPDRQLRPARLPPATSGRKTRALRRSRCLPCGSARVCAPPSTSSPPPPEAAPSPGGPPRGSRRFTRRTNASSSVARGVVTHRVWLSLGDMRAGGKRRTSRASGAELELRERSFTSARVRGRAARPASKRRAKTREKAQSSVSTPGRAGGESADRETGKGRLIIT